MACEEVCHHWTNEMRMCLLADLAAQAGAALKSVRLGVELQLRLEQISAQAVELRVSRQRIVSAQDAERRRLERDLHDGAQQHLVTLAVNASLTRELVRTEPGEAEMLLDEVRTQAQQALETLRDLARGIFPPALADRGLVAALEAHLVLAHRSARIDADGIGPDERFAPEVETAVYCCCLEALQNCAKHAPGSSIRVSLSRAEVDWLSFIVADHGPGFDANATLAGAGRHNMADRLAALDGTLEIRSAPGQGTTVSGRVPAAAVPACTPLRVGP